MSIEHKSVPVGGLEVVDDEKGIVEAIVSVTGVVDEVNDLIEPGAYQKTLVKRKPKGIWCADEATEILTKRGWLRYDQLEVGDEAYTIDGLFESVEAVNVFEGPHEVRAIETTNFSAVTTADHRWPVRLRNGDRAWRTTAELATNHAIYRSAARADAPDAPKWSDAFVELVGWTWTEGCIDVNGRVTITQSETVNAEKCDAIRRVLNLAGGHFEKAVSAAGQRQFCLHQALSAEIRSALGADKAPTPSFLLDLTTAQLHLLIDTCLAGDGTVAGGVARWMQRSEAGIAAFEMLCALAGVATNTRPRRFKGDGSDGHFGGDISLVTLKRYDICMPVKAVAVGGGVDEIRTHDGIVWCPTTPSHTWLARRNGSIYFTGNSHSWDTPVSKTLSAKELMPGDPELPTLTRNGEPWPKGAGALKVKMQFNLGTQRGREAYEDVKFFGADAEWSVGYKVPVGAAVMEQKSGGGGQIRRIREMDLYEFSPVLFGAMPLAATTSMKTAQQAMMAVKSVLAGEAETKAGGAKAPIKAHPYVDRDGDDKCDICGKAEDDHGKKARTKSLPDGLETKSAPASPAPADDLDGFDPEGASEADDVDELDAREVILSMVADGTASDHDLRDMGFDETAVAAFAEAKALYARLEAKVAGVEIDVPFEDEDEDAEVPDDELAALEREILLDAETDEEVFERVFEAALELDLDDETASDRAYAASRLFAAEAAAEAEEEAKDLIQRAFGSFETKAGGADKNRGGAEKLRRYWTRGAGAAKIRWGTPGDWTRCVAQLTKYLGPRAKGYCFGPETELLTRDGIVRFGDVVDQEVLVLTQDPTNTRAVRRDGRWVSTVVRSYGEQRLLTVTLRRGGETKTIRATPEHEWLAPAHLGTAYHHRIETVRTEDLKPGVSLAALVPASYLGETRPSTTGVMAGFTFGDGCRRGGGACATLWGEKDAALLEYFAGHPTIQRKTANGVLGVEVRGLPAAFKDLPALTEPVPYLLGWLAGYFAADGSVSADGRVVLSSKRPEHLAHARDVATRLGIATYPIRTHDQPSHFVDDHHMSHLTFVAETTPVDLFLLPEHRRRLEQRLEQMRGAEPPLRWRVESVEDHGDFEEVFCVEVEGTHTIVLSDWIWTRQCNLRHKEVNGFYPGDKKNKGGDDDVFVLDLEDVEATVAGLQAKAGRLLDEGKADRLRIATKDLADALRDALDEAGGEPDDVDLDDLLMEFETLKLETDI